MLKKKLDNKKGFTLAELLVVVAIIGILVAISVPIFTSKLEDARVATDEANMRSAKAAAVATALGEEAPSQAQTYYYDAASGKLETDKDGITGYGKSSKKIGDVEGTPAGGVIKVTVNPDGDVTLTWEASAVQ